MNIRKNINRLALAATVSVLALGMTTQARASDTVATVGHISASVGSALSIVETSPIKFGNIVVSGSTGNGDGSVTMTSAGVRTKVAGVDGVALLSGQGQAGAAAPAAGDDAGAESPGFYAITGANNATSIYISFAETGSADALIDTNHPNNNVTLTNLTDKFFVDTFTFNSSGSDTYGSYITSDGSGKATVQVGATLHTATKAANGGTNPVYADGAYHGTYDIMASY